MAQGDAERKWWQVWRFVPDWGDHPRSADELGLDTIHDHEICLNCNTPLGGPFCHVCGQRDDDLRRPFLALSNELLADTFQWDSRILRSIMPRSGSCSSRETEANPSIRSRSSIEGSHPSRTSWDWR